MLILLTLKNMASEIIVVVADHLLEKQLEELLQAQGEPGSTAYLKAVQQVKTLIMPDEMGERFKFIALTQGLDDALPGFRMQDMRERL